MLENWTGFAEGHQAGLRLQLLSVTPRPSREPSVHWGLIASHAAGEVDKGIGTEHLCLPRSHLLKPCVEAACVYVSVGT